MVDKQEASSFTCPLIRRNKSIRQVLIAAVIFVSGVVIGAGGMVLFFQYRAFRPPPPPKKMAAVVAREIRGQLGLTDEQAGQVEAIFAKEFQAADSIRQELQTRMDVQRKSLIAEMEMILTTEQFAQWRDEFQSRQRKMRGPFPPGPPPGDGPRHGDGPPPGDEPW